MTCTARVAQAGLTVACAAVWPALLVAGALFRLLPSRENSWP